MGTFEDRDEAEPRHAVVLANWVAERAEHPPEAASQARQRAASRRRARAMHPSARMRDAEVIPFPRRVS